MRVLVTRPLHSGERTAERLRTMGHEPLLLPLAHPVHHAQRALHALEQTDGAIAITSAEAIRALADRSGELLPHLNRPLFAVGEATAGKAGAIGFRRVATSSGNGRDLAEAIAARGHRSALYLAGSPRAASFETRASELSIRLTVAECYEMKPLDIHAHAIREALTDAPLDAILFYSRQTTDWFFSLPDVGARLPAMENVRLLCLSEPIARAVPPALQKNVAIAAMPDEPSLLSMI